MEYSYSKLDLVPVVVQTDLSKLNTILRTLKSMTKLYKDPDSSEELFNNHKKFIDDNYYLLNKLEQEIQACISVANRAFKD